jgi:gamma-glutamyltranspeptidase/glutathione hydrolase
MRIRSRLAALTLLALFATVLTDLPRPTAQTFRPVARGRRGVVAGGHPLSVEAGMRMLQRGGNAVDAGVATILAASVIEFSHFSFGGEVPILIKMRGSRGSSPTNRGSRAGSPRGVVDSEDVHKSGVVVIEGMGTAPAKATREFFANRSKEARASDRPTMAGAGSGVIPSTGPLSATVPAVLDACVVALDQFGTKSLAEVMQPAIELAEGFPLDELRVDYIKTRGPVLSQWPDAKRIFMPNGQTPKVGDVFVQADLARTLRAIIAAEKRNAGKGRHAALMAARDHFYRGPIGKRIGDYMQANGGLIAAADLAGWRATVGAPTRGDYRGYEIYKTGFWAAGPMLIEVLNLLEGYDLKKLGHNSPEYIHTVTEALKLGFADRDRFYGDPKFVKIPTEQLLSKNYAAMRRNLIEKERASLAQRPGDPANMKPLLASAATISYNAAPVPELLKANDTTCVNVIDKDGNMFSATPSGAWLPAVVAGDTGVLMGQRLQSALTDPNSPNVVAPGKRPRITLTPTLILKDGQPLMVLSTPGGDNQDQALLQVLLNIIEFGMSSQEAVEAPRFDTQHYISSFDNHEFRAGLLNLEARIPPDVSAVLSSRGHKINMQSAWGTGSAPTVIVYDVKSGVISGGADPRRGRYAVAW